MERVSTVLERECELLDGLLFKLIETQLILRSGDTRFLARATREVERARNRARELDLVRATTVACVTPGITLRALAQSAAEPWPGILRDHHHELTSLVSEIEVAAHQNATEARRGLDALRTEPAMVSSLSAPPQADLEHLARGAALETVMGSAARLHMPDLLDFLR